MNKPADPFIARLADHDKPLPVSAPPHGNAHRGRRDRLAAELAKASSGEPLIVLSFSGREISRNRDNTFPFRFGSDFFYLTGFPEPEAWLIMEIDPDGRHRDTLVCRPRDDEREIWDGIRVGPELASARYAMDASVSIERLQETIVQALKNKSTVVTPLASEPELDADLRRWMEAARAQARGGIQAPSRLLDLGEAVARLRLIKDSHELKTMSRAAAISAQAHCQAMRATRSGLAEFAIEAVLLAEFRRQGAQSVAYGSIVASGPHSCILHHRAGDRLMRDGDMLLIDAGCELDGYASDITRSFPVSGRFTSQQRAAYEIVLAAQQAAVDATRPGVAFTAPHDAAVRVLCQGLIDLQLLRDQSLDAAIETGAYKRFYMHRTGHWLGMDVHDVGDYRTPLAPGMVLTIEPGLYIRPAQDIPEGFWNVGIRIEDDAVVNQTGCELITRGVPVDPDEIETLMKEDWNGCTLD